MKIVVSAGLFAADDVQHNSDDGQHQADPRVRDCQDDAGVDLLGISQTYKAHSLTVHVKDGVVASEERGAKDPEVKSLHLLNFQVAASLPSEHILVPGNLVSVSRTQSEVDRWKEGAPLVVRANALVQTSKWVWGASQLLPHEMV